MPWQAKQFPLVGGINNEDPPFSVKPGSAYNLVNFECLTGAGYRRIDGYERYDGRASPSAAIYQTLSYNNGVAAINVGNTVTGLTSGATAYVLAVSGNTAAGTLVLTAVSGAFVNAEHLQVSAVTKSDASGTLVAADNTSANYKTWLSLAREYYRGLIGVVPFNGLSGTGNPVLGGFVLNGTVYAIRAGNSSGVPQPAKLYKATGSGWSVVDLGQYLPFNGGTKEITEGVTITGLASGATAVVKRVAVGSGNWAGPTFASGRLAIASVAGTFQANEGLTIGGVGYALATATQQSNALSAASGQFNVVIHNFYGGSNSVRAYGCDDGAVNRAWEFDGTTFCFIETGMTADTPNRIEHHRNYLFLSFAGGSLQNSGSGTPLTWNVRSGAQEIGIGSDISDLISKGDNALIVTAVRGVHVLLGTSNQDWTMTNIASEIGAANHSAQEAGGLQLFLDTAGVNIVTPPQIFGQTYGTQSISRSIRQTVQSKMSTTNVQGSIHAIKKNHYRVFFSDKTGIVATFNGGQITGWSTVNYNDLVTCTFHGVIGGQERMFIGTDGGYLMELDKGSSFDGVAISSSLQLPFIYPSGGNRNNSFHRATFEVTTPLSIILTVATDFNYGTADQSGSVNTVTVPTSGIYDLPQVELDGISKNIGITITHNDAVDDPFTVASMTLEFTPVGIAR